MPVEKEHAVSVSQKPRTVTWAVWRQDEQGGRYLVEVKPTEAEARKRVKMFSGLGYKQTYWCEPRAGRQTDSQR
jgi:hypothetical protein